ncbi:unnamed protein product, partial [Polarella glacialis]
FYSNSKCWMVTILTLHASPSVALRVAPWERMLLSSSAEDVAAFGRMVALIWVLTATVLRWKHSATPFSLAVSAVESSAALVPLSARLLRALLALNLLIIPVFWVALCIATLSSPKLSFVPLDRHLRLGWAHMARSRDAQYALLANFLLHGASQLFTAAALDVGHSVIDGSSLLKTAGAPSPLLRWGLRDSIAGLSVYWAVVCILAAAAGCARPYPVSATAGLGLAAAYWVLELCL